MQYRIQEQYYYKQKEIFMAFVYMSPRNLQLLKTPQPLSHSQNYSQYKQNILPKQCEAMKKPLKGLAHMKGVKKQQLQTQFYIVKDIEKMRQIRQKQISSNKKTSKPVQNEQHFFKTKPELKDEYAQISQQSFKCKGNNLLKKKNEAVNKKNKENKSPKDQQTSIKKAAVKQQVKCQKSQNTQIALRGINLLSSKINTNQVYAIPSIPGKLQKFGYVIKQDNISYPQIVPRPRYLGQKQSIPGPTDYNVSENKKIKNTPDFSKKKYLLSPEFQNQDFYALINDQEALKKHNQKIQEWVKQSRKKRKQLPKQKIIPKKDKQRDLSTASNESGQTVYEDTTTPGPGYYNYSFHEGKKCFRSKNSSLQKIFYSKSQRFYDLSPSKAHDQNFYNINQNTNSLNSPSLKKNKFFVSKLKRQIKMERNSIAPSPDHYDVRIGIQNDIIGKILKNSPNLFNNRLPRFANYDVSISPGPGAYCLDEPKFKIDSFSNSKKQQISLKREQLSKFQTSLIESPKEAKKLKIIHEKQQVNNDIEIPISAPFMSTSPKGLNIEANISMQSQFMREIAKSPKKKQNIYPFNSSECKIKRSSADYVAEVGLYELAHNEWDKKSYNILFN